VLQDSISLTFMNSRYTTS